MPRFTIRIELLDADSAQYDALYEHLDLINVVDEITDSEGIRYRLPPAEYSYDGPLERSDLLREVKRAVTQVVESGHDYRVLITQSASRTWHNLERI